MKIGAWVGKDKIPTSVPFGRESQEDSSLIPLPSMWWKEKQEGKWWGTPTVCSGPDRSVGLLELKGREEQGGVGQQFRGNLILLIPLFMKKIPFSSCPLVVIYLSVMTDFTTVEKMYLLSYNSWTKPDNKSLMPPLAFWPLHFPVKTFRHFLQSSAKFLTVPRRNWHPHFGPVASRNLSVWVLLNILFLDWLPHSSLEHAVTAQKRKLFQSAQVFLKLLCVLVLFCSAVHFWICLRLSKADALECMITAASYMAGLMLLPGLTLPWHLIMFVPFSTVCYFLQILTATKQGLIIKKKYRFPLQSYLE